MMRVPLAILAVLVALAIPSSATGSTEEIFAVCNGEGVFLQFPQGGDAGLNEAIHIVGDGSFKVVSRTVTDLSTGETFTETSNFPGTPDTTCVYARAQFVFTLEGVLNGSV
jgi:hypothetical protein